MATIYVWLDDMVGVAGMYLFLRTAAGALVNADGDALTDPSSTGRFQATVSDSLTGLGTLRARVSDSSDEADAFMGGWLAEGSTIVIDDYPASGALTNEQAEQLAEIHEALYPADPDTSPLVIVPSPDDTVTGWAVCYGLDGQPEADVDISYKLQSGPQADTARIFNGATSGTATSAENGVVQFAGLIPGATYWFSSGVARVSITVPADADPETGFELPSFTRRT